VVVEGLGRYRTITGPSAWMLRVRAEGSGVWLGTQGGAARVGSDGEVTPVAGLPDGRVHEVRTVAGRRYFGTEGGLLIVRAAGA